MKPTLHLFALSLLGLLLAACHETADDNTEFSNWQERNESYFQQKYLSAVNGTALQDKTFVLTKWSLNDSITTKAEDHIVVEVLEEGTGSGCPLFTDSVRVHFRGHTIPTNASPDGYVITGYSVQTGVYQAATYTLTAEDGTSITPANLGNTYTPLNVSGLSATSTTITVTTTDASKWLSLANFVVTMSRAPYTRAVTPGRWGTVCVPGAVAAANISGAEIYRIAGKTVNAEDKPTSLKVEQVEDMEAGKPYLFLPSESQLSLTYYGSTIVNAPDSENGLIGSFEGMDVAPGYYLLSNNKIVLCGANCDIAANRAYIDMDAVPLYTGETGVKSLDVYCDDPDGISLIPDTTPEGDGRIYDLSGRYISNSRLPKGIYIMNGRKMIIK